MIARSVAVFEHEDIATVVVFEKLTDGLRVVDGAGERSLAAVVVAETHGNDIGLGAMRSDGEEYRHQNRRDDPLLSVYEFFYPYMHDVSF